jgi:hypothetical protein
MADRNDMDPAAMPTGAGRARGAVVTVLAGADACP